MERNIVMKRKLLSVFLSIVLLISLLYGCGVSRTAEKKKNITLIIKCPVLIMKSVTDADVIDTQYFLEKAAKAFAEQYDKANVTFEVMVFDYIDEGEAITGSFDTDYAMDILYEDYFNMSAYIYTGRVVPLDDMITDDIRSDIDEAAWELSSVNGKTYMMPYLSRQNVLIYNKKLLSDCGLTEFVSQNQEIQNWTVEEWTYILDTLAQKLPENVYPMMMYGKNNQGDTHIMSLIRAFGSTIFDENGNFNFEGEEAVKALEWIQDGVDRGWYPPHSENLEIADAQELFNNSQLAFYVYNNANIVQYTGLDDYGFVNFPGNIATSFVTGFEVFDNGDAVKTSIAKDFIKYIYETEELLELSAGNIPESKKTAQKYAEQIEMFDEFSKNAVNVVDFMNGSPNWQGCDTSVRSVFWPNIHRLLLGMVTPKECAAALDNDCNKALEAGRQQSTLHD
jgi:multiple sugar transport system substrate-binding protein